MAEAQPGSDPFVEFDRAYGADPVAEDVHIRGLVFRSPGRLPVVFDPA